MALKADGPYGGATFSGVVFEVGPDVHIVIPTNDDPNRMSFQVKVWLTEAARAAGNAPMPVPEWEANLTTWNPAGAAPLTQAYDFVRIKLTAAGWTNIAEIA